MRSKRIHLAGAVAVLAVAAVVATTALAGGEREVRTQLTGFQEVPAVSTDAGGKFKAQAARQQRGDPLRAELRRPHGRGPAGPHPPRASAA